MTSAFYDPFFTMTNTPGNGQLPTGVPAADREYQYGQVPHEMFQRVLPAQLKAVWLHYYL